MILIGGSSFVVGKALGPLFSVFAVEKNIVKQRISKVSTKLITKAKIKTKAKGVTKSIKKEQLAFKVIDDGQGLKVCDDTGEEIFHFDNEA
jgi:hypothetical protein